MTIASARGEHDTDEQLWWQKPFRMFQTNIREIDAGLDVDRVLDQIIDYGANTWLISVGGIISNYPTALAHQSPNPHLSDRPSGDLIGDAVSAGSKLGVRVVARMDFSKVARRIAMEHPEWLFVGPDGRHQVYQGLTSVCPSADYYQSKVFEVLEEVLARYEIDGFFFNWMSFNEVDYDKRYRGVCHCVSCRTGYAEMFDGAELPNGPDSPGYEQWRGYTASVIDDLLARVRAFIAERRPQAPLIMGVTADMVFHEANNAIGRELWPAQTQERVSLARSHRPHVPVLVNSVGFVDMPYRLVSEDPRHFAQYLLQAMATGANPSTYIMGVPDEFNYPSLRAGSEIIRFHRDHEKIYHDLVPAARTGLVSPASQRHGGVLPGQQDATDEFRGWWQALSADHIPFDALDIARLAEIGESGGLDRYRLLILPDLGVLEPDVVKTLDRWVHAGGRLLTTGSSGFADGASQLSANPATSRLAVLDTPETTWSSVVLTDPDDRSTALPILGALHVATVREGARRSGAVLSRAPYGPPEKCYGHLPLDTPASAVVEHGEGRGAAIFWTPGRAHRHLGLTAIAEEMVAQARVLLGDDRDVDTDLPAQVEVIMGSSRAGLVLHLNNVSGRRHQGFSDPLTIPVGRRLWIHRPGVQSIRALVADVEITRDDDGAFTLPEIGAFEVLVG
ncbi:beta-galactosidase trimerization domain-containing protein [Pseudactinotalea sp. Z1739]|uniref:beta-galactosidase trimerization domain-containing protein n=1 Tax=Pseudactinotalea sp. Z1739 TaxID=3413028 RepID=UPI003C7A2ADA